MDSIPDIPEPFLERIAALPLGYSEGLCDGRRYGITLRASADGRRRWLFAEELGGTDRISCNLYQPAGRAPLLRPCEMPATKVIEFVLGLRVPA
ncbi:hypothetical protein [Roseomonas elaeocarpi]|uniref:Uncharacterized protein n=1 Tax=Roseomonas elaeocarpi TaxID=907779 RepID=A0ABV6JSA4_9PROT